MSYLQKTDFVWFRTFLNMIVEVTFDKNPSNKWCGRFCFISHFWKLISMSIKVSLNLIFSDQTKSSRTLIFSDQTKSSLILIFLDHTKTSLNLILRSCLNLILRSYLRTYLSTNQMADIFDQPIKEPVWKLTWISIKKSELDFWDIFYLKISFLQ